MTKRTLAGAILVTGTLLAVPALAQPWQYSSAAERRAEQLGSLYTTALNALYAHGFHHVHGMWLRNGEVHAMALNSNEQPTAVVVDPGTSQIQAG